MIYQNTQNENTQNKFSDAIKELQIGKLLRKSNVNKSCGILLLRCFNFYFFSFSGKESLSFPEF